jgi:hypothetical protein
MNEKMWYIRKMFWACPENFYGITSSPPRRQHFRQKFLDAFFIRKVPLKAWPRQLLEASYAPGFYTGLSRAYLHVVFACIFVALNKSI